MTIILYKDGTCESLEFAIETRKQDRDQMGNPKPIVDAETQKILNTSCLRTFNGTILLTYFVKNDTTNEIEFVYYKLDDATFTIAGPAHTFRLVRPQLSASLAGYTVVDGDMHPSLLTICKTSFYFFLFLI